METNNYQTLTPKKIKKGGVPFFPSGISVSPHIPCITQLADTKKREVDSLRPRCSKGIAGDVLLLLYLYKMFKSVASLVLYCGALAALQK